MTAKKKTEPDMMPAAQTDMGENKMPSENGGAAESKSEGKKQAPAKKQQLTLASLAERMKQLADVVTRMADGQKEDAEHTGKMVAAITGQEAATGKLLNEILKQQKQQAAIIADLNDRLTAIEEREEALRNDSASRDSVQSQFSRLHSRLQALEHPKAEVIEIKALDSTKPLIIPTPSKDGSIGDDLETVEDIWINHGRNVIPTNICINLPRGIEGKIEARSGFSIRGIYGRCVKYVSDKIFGIFRKPAVEVEVWESMNADVTNGKVDPGYRDGVGIIVNNRTVPFMIPKGTRLAQITYYKTVAHRYRKVEEFSDEAPYVADRKGGFGSSNKEEKHED